MKKQELIQNLKNLRDNYPDNGRYDGVKQGLLIAIGAIQNLEEPKKVVVPKFIAEWIEEMKQDERPLYSAMSSLMNKTNHEWAVWKSGNKNFSEIVAQAWLDGYEIEKEKLYYIVDKNDEVLWFRNGQGVPRLSGSTLRSVLKSESKQRYQFTEQEIKDYDERFWPFAVPVEVVE